MNIKQLAELLEIPYDKEPLLELKGLMPANDPKAAYVSLGFSIAKEKRPNLLKEAIWILDEPCDDLPYVLVFLQHLKPFFWCNVLYHLKNWVLFV